MLYLGMLVITCAPKIYKSIGLNPVKQPKGYTLNPEPYNSTYPRVPGSELNQASESLGLQGSGIGM